MVLSAFRGALGFLTRVPVGGDGEDWRAFTDAPWTFPAVGVLVGAALAFPVLAGRALDLPLLGGVAFLVGWVGLLGITHLDGVADLADAAIVHGDTEARVAALKDSAVGVGAVVALVVALLGTAFAGVALAGRAAAPEVIAAVVAAELGAKTAMAVVACGFEARHEGLGSQLTDWNGRRDLALVALVAFAVVLATAAVVPAAAVFAPAVALAAVLAGWVVARRANRLLGGVNGDVFGAVDVVARAVGLWAGAVLLTAIDTGVAPGGVL